MPLRVPVPPQAHTCPAYADACICKCLQVSEALYIEPSTGRQYPVKQCPYEGVEYMWNNQNIWVCMQMPEPHSDSRASAAALSLDMRNSSKWESLLYEPQPMVGHGALHVCRGWLTECSAGLSHCRMSANEGLCLGGMLPLLLLSCLPALHHASHASCSTALGTSKSRCPRLN